MDHAQTSRAEALIQVRSPYDPPPNSPEPAQPTIPPLTPRSSTTNPETPIFSPTPTRPRRSQVAEAGPFTTSMTIEIDTTPRNVLAEIDQCTERRSSTEVIAPHRLRELSEIGQRRRRHERMEREEPGEAGGESAHRAQYRREHKARIRRERRLQASSPDDLANSLSALSTNEPELNIRQENIRRIQRQNRESRARQDCRARDLYDARRLQQMRDVEQSIQRRVEGSNAVAEENSMQRADAMSVSGGPTIEDAYVQMFGPSERNKPRDFFERYDL